MLARWGGFVYARRRLVLLLSVLGLVVSIALLATVAPDLSSEGFVDENAESARVDATLEEFGRGGDSIIFLFDADQPVSDPAVRAAIEGALAPLEGDDRLRAVLTTWNTGNPGFVSIDGMSTYAVAQIAPGAEVLPDDIAPEVEAAAEAAGLAGLAGLTVNVTGGEAIGEEIAKGVEEGLIRAETFSIPLTIVIQLVVFGGLVAAGVPLLVGAFAIVGAVGLTFLLSTGTFQSVFAVNIITMLGLGLGIDYSLFMVARFREEIKHRTVADAVSVSMATIGKAILFSGVTVIFGLGATQFFPLPALRSMGQAGMVVVALALVYGLTFLPALLAVLGPRINAVSIGMPGSRRRQERRPAAPSGAAGGEGGFWHTVAEGVMRRPVVVLVAVLAVLLAASVPFARLDLTPGGPEVLPEGNSVRVAAERLNTDFAGDEADPIPVIVTADDGNALSAASVAGLRAVVAEAQALPNVVRVESVVSDPAILAGVWDGYAGDPATLPAEVQAAAGQTVRNDQALVSVVTSVEGSALEDLVRDLRDLSPAGVGIQVGGDAGAAVDTVDGIASGVIPALIFVIVGSYLILLLTFGSVFLPLKAIFMTLLSIGASLGILVLVFQDGIGESLLGFQATGEIISTTPILMFCILFGLSMDYEVLMLSRIQEEYLRTGDNRASVALGLERTAKVVTGAALIMVVVFGGFMLADIVIIKSMGFGLALAVLIDATIVRGLLVPATMRLMGRWNWWAPDWITTIVHRVGLGHAEVPVARTGVAASAAD